jgi:hypothetical protein
MFFGQYFLEDCIVFFGVVDIPTCRISRASTYLKLIITIFSQHRPIQKNLFGIPLCLEDSLDPTLHSSLPQCRSRDGVALQYRPVDGDGDALAGGRVQLGRFDTSGLGSALSTDLEVDAVGVVLSTVGLVGGVEGNDLVAEDVRACNQGRRDCDNPGVVVCNEGI